jgi:phage/plasmid primase-like uncharacterized protein
LFDSGTPLLGQRFAVDKDEGRGAAFGDHGAGHDGLAGSWWGDKHTVIVGEKRTDRNILRDRQFRAERDIDLAARVSLVRDHQP